MSNVSIKAMRIRGTTGKLKAFFTVAIDDIEVDDMRLIVGSNGPFIGFPSKKYTKKDGTEDWAYTVRPARDENGNTTARGKELETKILAVALKEFERRSGESLGTLDEEKDDLPF